MAAFVEHTSETELDGTGYDIRSYELSGEIKHIEFNTTRASINTPISHDNKGVIVFYVAP